MVVDVVEEILRRCERDFLGTLGNTWQRNVTGVQMSLSQHLPEGYTAAMTSEAPGTTTAAGGGGGGTWPSAYPTKAGAVREVMSNVEYNVCDHCNFSEEDLEALFSSGTCTPSDFSSYMPLIYQMYACIFVIALLGNTLVLYTVASSRKMHTVTNLFIANLAVGDLLIMVFCVPFSVASIIVLQYWPFGEALCVFVNYSQVRDGR